MALARLPFAALLLGAAASPIGCSGSDEFVPIGTLSTTAPARADMRWLNVHNEIGSIRLVPGRADEISVRARVAVRESLRSRCPSAELARDLDVKIEGQIVTVQSRCFRQADASDWKLDLEIEAPARLNWTLMQTAGDVHVEADGNAVIANVAAGAIEVSGSPGHVELLATAGAVWIDVARVADGTVHASAGEVRLVVRDSGPSGGLVMTTDTGAIDVELPANASVEVDLSATVGAIEVQGAPDVKPERDLTGARATGTLGKGGPHLTANAGLGRVRFVVRD